jgi:tetratricopeptide (TPR) repeat protein
MSKRPITPVEIFRSSRAPRCRDPITWCRGNGRVAGVFCFVLILFLVARPSPGQSGPSPQPSAAGLKAGVQALFAGDFARAESAARQQLAVNSRAVDALVLLARAQMAQAKYQLAFGTLRRALKDAPDNIEALYFMGKLTSALSQMEYQRLAQLAPDSGRVHQLMGDSYQAAGSPDKAREEYRTALALQPDLRDAALELAEISRTQGRFEEALKLYLQILERTPRHFPSLYGAGLCYQALQDDDHSREFFTRAADADPSDAASRYALGAVLMRKGESAKAIEALEAAVRLDPSLQGAYSLLGRAFTLTGQPDRAAQAFERARQLLNQELQTRQQKAKKAVNAPIRN